MTAVLGRTDPRGETGRIGAHLAPDGSDGAALFLDLDHPHAGLVVGKRGYGKSYTLGVLAEELARASGVAPVVVDPMGVFTTLADGDESSVPARVVDRPRVPAGAVDPPAWCRLLGLDSAEPAGALVWQAAAAAGTLAGMSEHVADATAADATVRAATNHLRLARSWGVFDPDGMTAADVNDGAVTVVDASGLDPGPMNAVVRALAADLYAARVADRIGRLPWLLVDEAHALFGGIAGDALETLLTRGRQPGASLVVATQRPSAVPDTVPSQADLLLAHRLTARPDLEALRRARPSYADGALDERMPTDPGQALLVDDASESVHTLRIRERDTPHGGASPRASDYRDR